MNALKKLAKWLTLLVSLVVLLILKAAHPIVRVQLCIVGFHRYGHLALEPEIFLAEREIENSKSAVRKRTISIWSLGPVSKQANTYLAGKWKKKLTVLPSWIIDALHRAGSVVPFLRLHEPRMSITGSLNGLDKTGLHLAFSQAEMLRGQKEMISFGINPYQPYVCLVVRDGGHYKAQGNVESAGYEFLNFNIEDFSGAASILVANGYQVIRMGSGSERPFLNKPEGVIDYALANNRTEFLDVFIAGTCEFAVSTQTGPDAVCMLFRRPVLYVDVTRYGQFFFGTSIATWSPVRLIKSGNVLKLSEIINSEIAWFKDPGLFAANGISQQKSSEGELRELISLYVENRKSPAPGSPWAQKLVAEGMGERGRRQFGDVTATLLSHAEQVLGEWVLK